MRGCNDCEVCRGMYNFPGCCADMSLACGVRDESLTHRLMLLYSRCVLQNTGGF